MLVKVMTTDEAGGLAVIVGGVMHARLSLKRCAFAGVAQSPTGLGVCGRKSRACRAGRREVVAAWPRCAENKEAHRHLAVSELLVTLLSAPPLAIDDFAPALELVLRDEESKIGRWLLLERFAKSEGAIHKR